MSAVLSISRGAPTILSAVGARRLTKRIREALQLADDLLVEAWRGRAWEALGHETWADYCAAELPDLRMIRLADAELADRVAGMRVEGMPVRAIAAPLGVSVGKVAKVLGELREAGRLDDEPAEVVALDGRRLRSRGADRQAPPVEPPAQMTKTARAEQLVAEQGDRGLTVRELCALTDWHHGQASGTLAALHAQGRLLRTETRRLGCRSYLAPRP